MFGFERVVEAWAAPLFGSRNTRQATGQVNTFATRDRRASRLNMQAARAGGRAAAERGKIAHRAHVIRRPDSTLLPSAGACLPARLAWHNSFVEG